MRPIEGARYIVGELREHGDDREWWRGRVNTRLNSPVQRHFRPQSEAIDVTEADWDVLIVLDACRNDLFSERTVDLEAEFTRQTVQSRGSSTREWLDQNFTEEYGDTVYVTGNPQVTKYKQDRFHRLIEVWREGFDGEDLTIPARAVTDAAIQAREQYPNKRLIVHYVQPHEPFVGHPDLNFFSWDDTFPSQSEGTPRSNKRDDFEGTAFGAIYHGAATREEVWEAYLDNLDYVLDDVNRLLGSLGGKVVVTSDHGNAFPRFSWPVPVRVWSHPPGLRLGELITVPWLETTLSDRPRIVDEGVTPATEYDEAELNETLAHLGYR